jgi:hypothetical protein
MSYQSYLPLSIVRAFGHRFGFATTKTGLSVRCEIDKNLDPNGVTVSNAEMAALIHHHSQRIPWRMVLHHRAKLILGSSD